MVTTTKQKDSSLTKALLTCAVVAGPIYILVGLLEGMLRPGFNFTKHDLSTLANGDLGWIHMTMLMLTGALVIAGAVGVRRVLRSNRGGTWAPLLLGLYGLGLIGAGIFSADPAYGFPIGTPADYHAVSSHGLMHLISGSIGFLGLIAACFVMARRFKQTKESGWQNFSLITGVFYFLAFFGIAAGSQQGAAVATTVILTFTAAVVLGWTWITMVAKKLQDE